MEKRKDALFTILKKMIKTYNNSLKKIKIIKFFLFKKNFKKVYM